MKHYKWVRQNEQTPDGKSHMRKSIKLVSTHHICSQGWWREMSSHQLQCTFNQVTQKFIWSMPKVDDIFSQLNGVKYFSTLDLWAGYHHIPLDESSIPKQHWPCHLENMNTSKYLLHSNWLQQSSHPPQSMWCQMKRIAVFNVKNQNTLLDIVLILGAVNATNMIILPWTAHTEYLLLELQQHITRHTKVIIPDQVQGTTVKIKTD